MIESLALYMHMPGV